MLLLFPLSALLGPDGRSARTFRSQGSHILSRPTPFVKQPPVVALDYFYNHEFKKSASGQPERFHYTWEDEANSGFSRLGQLFRSKGAVTDSLASAPTATNLHNSAVYIIVDPDTDKETTSPNYMQPAEAAVIAAWVHNGGVLLLMANDSGNAEFTHFNLLAAKFGIRFQENCINHVTGNEFEMGRLAIKPGDRIFPDVSKIYIKEMASMQLKPPARAYYTNHTGNVLMATAKYGKGTVFAVGDPWLYNEYIDNRRLPASFQNFAAATDLVTWLLQQVPGAQ